MLKSSTNWVFGYGSLIWRPDFAFTQRRTAKLTGFVRRFWQGSPDHRGTVEAPGRVVTLVPAPGDICHGVAYEISPDNRQEVIRQLDIRESGGYSRIETTIDIGRPIHSIVYVADQENPYFLGASPTADMAAHIVQSQGPSGRNLDYLLKLKTSLDHLHIRDPHIDALVEAVGGA